MLRSHRTASAVTLSLAIAFAGGVPGTAQRHAGGEEVTVFAVEVPVQVLRDGEPVRGLTAEDFTVVENGRAQRLIDFEVVDLAALDTRQNATAPAAPPPPSGRRHFLLLFDLAYSDLPALLRARQAAHELVRSSLHPSDLVAVARYSAAHGVELVLGFTPDRTQLAQAIETLGFTSDPRTRIAASEPLRLMLEGFEPDDSTLVQGDSGSIAGAAGKGAALGRLQDAVRSLEAQERHIAIDEVAQYASGMSRCADLLKGVEGRKYVVLLSQGFDLDLLTGSTEVAAGVEDRKAVILGEHWKVDQQERFGDARGRNALAELLDAFRRADTTVYTIDISGLTAPEDLRQTARGRELPVSAADLRMRPSGRDALFAIADGTGGRLFENTNDLAGAMAGVLHATSVTYVLTFQPPNVEPNGRFHPVEVRLIGAAEGARVVHPPGYYAPEPWQEVPELERRVRSAQRLLAGVPGGELIAGVAAAPFPTATEDFHVPVIVEVEGDSIRRHAEDERIALQFFVYALDAEPRLRDYVAQTVRLDLAQVGGRLRRESLKFSGDLLLPPGRYDLRVLVQTVATGEYWLGTLPLEVSIAATPALLPPLFPEPLATGIVARAASAATKTAGLPFPYTLGDEMYLPDGLPVLELGHEAEVVLLGRGLPEAALRLQAELLGPDDEPVGSVDATVRERIQSAPDGLDRLRVELRPARLPPGRYTLRLTVGDGPTRLTSATPVRVDG